VDFTLDFFVGEDGATSVEFAPGDKGTHLLPAFLQGPITFEASQCPMFLSKVIDALRHMTEESDDAQAQTEEESASASAAASVSTSASVAAEAIAAAATGTPARIVDRSAVAMEDVNDDTPLQPQVLMFGGQELTIESATPAAVRRARQLNLATPSVPPSTAGRKRVPATPAATPGGPAPGARAPACTPAPTALSAMAESAAVDEDEENPAQNLAAVLAETCAEAEADAAAEDAEMTAPSSVTASVRARQAAAARNVPATAMTMRKSSRLTGSASANAGGSMSARIVRRSIGHVVSPAGLVFKQSPGGTR
jgi:hypothetical protein